MKRHHREGSAKLDFEKWPSVCPTAKGKSRLREYSVKSHGSVWPDWCTQSLSACCRSAKYAV